MINKIAISIKAYHARTGEQKSEELCRWRRDVTPSRHESNRAGGIRPLITFGHLPNGHIVAALLARHTLIFKPSELTPYGPGKR